jgi:hypothetical protein
MNLTRAFAFKSPKQFSENAPVSSLLMQCHRKPPDVDLIDPRSKACAHANAAARKQGRNRKLNVAELTGKMSDKSHTW